MANQADTPTSQEVEDLKRRLAEVEDELRQSRSQLANLGQHYATAPVGLCLLDTDLNFVHVNQCLADINGRSIKDHLGTHLSKIVPQIYDFVEPIYRRVIETGEPALNFEVEGVAPFAPDVISTFLANYFPVSDEDGQVVGVSTVIQDITARKQAEEAHRESEARLRTILDNAPEAIVVLDTDTERFVDWNDKALELFGFDGETFAAQGPTERSPPRQPDGQSSEVAARVLIEQALAGKTPVFEWIHLHADGTEIPCEVRLVRIPMAGRNVVRGSITDITERKRADEHLRRAHTDLEERVAQRTAELARSEERWRSLIATAPDLILTADADGIIQYSNRDEAGYQPEDVAKTCVYDYVSIEYRPLVIQAVASVLQTGECHSLEHSITGADGKTEWLQTRIGPYWENGKIVGATSISTNITRRKEAEESIKAEQQLLKQLLTLQENERRMVSHDIHDGFVQYVVGAQMSLQAIPYPAADDDHGRSVLDDIESYLRKAIAEGRRLIRDLRPMVLDEAGIVESLTHLIADEERNDRLTIAFDHDVRFERLEPVLEGAIFRIVQESLNNVKQHSQVSHVGVQLIQREETLHIHVRDQGVGFDPQQVDPDRFGLRGIRERARLFGGKVTIESAPNKGTSILVMVPVSTAPDEESE